jgi:anti-sigma factor RsiW
VVIVQHVTDGLLERYAMQRLPDSETGPMEEHLMICPECRDRLEAEIEFVTAMRGAAVRIRCNGIS